MNDDHSAPGQPFESATEPVFTTRFAHELQLVRDTFNAHEIPYSSVEHDPWSQKWSADLASQDIASDVRWTVFVPPSVSRRAHALLESLPVSTDHGAANALSEQEVRRGTAIVVGVVLTLLLGFLVMFFLARLR